MSQRKRNFTFTQNNYSDTELVDNIICKYIIYGKEIGELGTPHLQGTIVFVNDKSLKAVIKELPGCHVEICRDVHASILYCKKDGDYTERGEAPLSPKEKGKKEKNRWKRILEAAENGDTDWLREEEPQVYLLHDRALERAYKRHKATPQTLDLLEHQWYYGEPGSGKSRKAREDYPDAYIKDPKSIWWDGYNGEETVIIDDFDKYQVAMGGEMKRWLDRYPFQAQYKGGSELIRPKRLIITSNYSPDEIWDDTITQDAIKRRVHITHFSLHAYNNNK